MISRIVSERRRDLACTTIKDMATDEQTSVKRATIFVAAEISQHETSVCNTTDTAKAQKNATLQSTRRAILEVKKPLIVRGSETTPLIRSTSTKLKQFELLNDFSLTNSKAREIAMDAQ
jgi:hypothetical protein